MSKITVTGFMLSLVLLFTPFEARSRNPATMNSPGNQLHAAGQSHADGGTGTLQKMIVESGSVTMELDVNRLNGIEIGNGKLERVQFAVAANSFFSILVFNDLLRGTEPGSMAVVSQNKVALPAALTASINRLVIEKATSNGPFDVTVRDALSGFVFFEVQGNQYDYNASARLLTIQGGRLLISKEFAAALGRASDAGAQVGNISVGAAMQAIQITQLSNGAPKSVLMPPLSRRAVPGAPTLAAGPDVIVGDLPNMVQLGSAGSQVGLAIATTSCNNGDQPINWFALPNTDHPVVPQNFYRMSGGASNNERFEQIGQSWMKHTFGADELDECNLGCNTNNCTQWTTLCPGCSDPYDASENGDRTLIGSRAWINPFTGSFPSSANNHAGHVHDGVSHRMRVETSDLDTTQNQGAIYFAEAAYITPHEYTWCQSHPGQCNMYDNVSYRQYNVTGSPPNFTFSPAGATVRKQAAIRAWTGAIVNQVQPDPANDGICFMGYNVTNPSTGVWHYEYAIYNMNLDRAIQSFSVPLGAGVNISKIDFHAPPQEPGWANDGTFNNQGYSSTPWTVTQASDSITWNTETFAQNQNANAIRWGTLYNFRFDSNQAPHTTTATVGFFKTGAPLPVVIEAPVLADATPTPTPTASPSATLTPIPTHTATATPTSTATATATATAIATSTPTPTPTPRATLTPRSTPQSRPRPTPPPRT